MNDNKLSVKIMRRVYFIHTLRKLASPLALRLYVLALAVVGTTSLVSVGNIMANIPGDGVFALYDFSMYAFMHTEFAVQVLIFGILGLLAWIARDCARFIGALSLSHSRHV